MADLNIKKIKIGGVDYDIEDTVARAGAVPAGTEAGEALIFDGTQWKPQAGYGYETGKDPAGTITWDGNTEGKDTSTVVETGGEDEYTTTLYKINDKIIFADRFKQQYITELYRYDYTEEEEEDVAYIDGSEHFSLTLTQYVEQLGGTINTEQTTADPDAMTVVICWDSFYVISADTTGTVVFTYEYDSTTYTDTVTVSSEGTYLYKFADGDEYDYVSNATYGSYATITKIDDKFIYPQNASAGTAIVYNGNEWQEQTGYAFKSGEPAGTVEWDGDTTDKETISLLPLDFFKASDKYISLADLEGQTIKLYPDIPEGMLIDNDEGASRFTLTELLEALEIAIVSGDCDIISTVIYGDAILALSSPSEQTLVLSVGGDEHTINIGVGTYFLGDKEPTATQCDGYTSYLSYPATGVTQLFDADLLPIDPVAPVQIVDSSSTHDTIPTSKAVYDAIQAGGIPAGTKAGQALIWNGTEWKKQEGYGYVITEGTAKDIHWDGDTEGKEYVTIGGESYYKVSDKTIGETSEMENGQCIVNFNGTDMQLDLGTPETLATAYSSNYTVTGDNIDQIFVCSGVIISKVTTTAKFTPKSTGSAFTVSFAPGIYFGKTTDMYIKRAWWGDPDELTKIDTKFIDTVESISEEPTEVKIPTSWAVWDLVKSNGYNIIEAGTSTYDEIDRASGDCDNYNKPAFLSFKDGFDTKILPVIFTWVQGSGEASDEYHIYAGTIGYAEDTNVNFRAYKITEDDTWTELTVPAGTALVSDGTTWSLQAGYGYTSGSTTYKFDNKYIDIKSSVTSSSTDNEIPSAKLLYDTATALQTRAYYSVYGTGTWAGLSAARDDKKILFCVYQISGEDVTLNQVVDKPTYMIFAAVYSDVYYEARIDQSTGWATIIAKPVGGSVPQITITVDQIISQNPITAQLTDAQAAIVENDTYNGIMFDVTALGNGRQWFVRSSGAGNNSYRYFTLTDTEGNVQCFKYTKSNKQIVYSAVQLASAITGEGSLTEYASTKAVKDIVEDSKTRITVEGYVLKIENVANAIDSAISGSF